MEQPNPYVAAYRKGLVAFIKALEQTDPKNETTFRQALTIALGRFGLEASSQQGTDQQQCRPERQHPKTNHDRVRHLVSQQPA